MIPKSANLAFLGLDGGLDGVSLYLTPGGSGDFTSSFFGFPSALTSETLGIWANAGGTGLLEGGLGVLYGGVGLRPVLGVSDIELSSFPFSMDLLEPFDIFRKSSKI